MSVTALRWGCELLREIPVRLVVGPDGESHARRAVAFVSDCDVELDIDRNLRDLAWLLQGQTREVYSEGA